jgi:hypothetical protein
MRAFLTRSQTASRFAVLLAGAAGIAIALSATAWAQSYPTSTTITTETRNPAGSTITTETRTIAPWAPPELRTEVIPPAPSDLVVWTPGHWQWMGDNWAWQPGQYVTRPQATAMWEPGHWVPHPAGGFLWVDGHWN